MEEQHKDNRRTIDNNHNTPCPILQDYISIFEQIHADLQIIKQTLTETKEMLEAFKNAKGFIKTVKIMGDFAKWMLAIGALATAFYLWVRK